MMVVYAEYKSTSYDWLSIVPAHWSEITARSILKLSNLRNKPETDYELLSVYREYGVIIKSSRDDNRNVASMDLSKYKVIKPGYLVMNKMKMWQGSLGVSPHKGIVSPAYIVCKVSDNVYGKYLHYLLRFAEFKTFYNRISYGIRVGQWDMKYDDFKNLKLYMPTIDEQNKIARYLDYQTVKISKFIKAKRTQIALLKEQRVAEINYASTKGIISNVMLKPSGINWLGDIPEHWEVVQSKRLFTLRKEKARPDDVQLTASQKYGVIEQGEFVRLEGRRVTVVIKGSEILKHVEPDDFVISMRSFQGGLERSKVRGCISSAYVMIIPGDDVEPAYFRWLLKSPDYIKALQSTSDLVRDGQAMRFSNFAAIPLVKFSKEEQLGIANYLSK